MDELQQGTILHGRVYQYEIVKKLGQGSFGITYLALMKTSLAGTLGAIDTEVKVALKEFFIRDINGRDGVLVTSGSNGGIYNQYKRNFIREAQNLSKLQHPNIIKVVESFEANNTIYFVMEYIDGGSLDTYISLKGKLTEGETLRIAKKIGEALTFMHQNHMLHLDLKPANIMMRENGDPVLIDFGLSKQYDEVGMPETSTTLGAGTSGYAPLEQVNYVNGENNEFPMTMDVYALGATMFKMLTGMRVPHASDIFNDGFPFDKLDACNVSKTLSACIAKAMSPRKDNRFQTVNDFIFAIEKGNVRGEETDEGVYPLDEETYIPYDNVKNGRDDRQNDNNKSKSFFESKTKKVALYLFVAVIALAIGSGIYMAMVKPKKIINEYGCPDNNHPHKVDLGLESGTLWACCNMGASSPEDYGVYFAWGELENKRDFRWKNYQYYDDSTRSFVYIGDISGTKNDVAHMKLEGSWQMPTKEQIEELIKKCSFEWIKTDKGIEGGRFTGENGNCIFLPAAGAGDDSVISDPNRLGCYWAGTIVPNDSIRAFCLIITDEDPPEEIDYETRCDGLSIRPVIKQGVF